MVPYPKLINYLISHNSIATTMFTNKMEAVNNSKVKLASFDPKQGLDRGVSRITEVIWYFIKIAFFLTAIPYPSKFKGYMLKLFGAKIGERVIIKPRVNIHMPWKLSVGDDTWIGEEVFVLNFEFVNIGSNVCISQRAFLCAGNHNYKDPAMPYKNGPISLKDGSWIGAGCFIGPNVVIGYDTVLTAYSTITNNTLDNSIYKGNPAVFFKNRW